MSSENRERERYDTLTLGIPPGIGGWTTTTDTTDTDAVHRVTPLMIILILSLRAVRYIDIFILLAWAILLHIAYLIFNSTAATLLRLESEEWIAVVLLTSQKTLPVTISVLSFLPESEVGEQGLLAVPPIIGHISQLIIDSVLVSFWAARALAKTEAIKEAGTSLLEGTLLPPITSPSESEANADSEREDVIEIRASL